MSTLETSLEANYDRRTSDGRTDGQTDKATYRGTSYRSAQKECNINNNHRKMSTNTGIHQQQLQKYTKTINVSHLAHTLYLN